MEKKIQAEKNLLNSYISLIEKVLSKFEDGTLLVKSIEEAGWI